MDEGQSNYLKFRGKCKEMCDALCAEDPTLIQVRGYYMEWLWSEPKQAHWWCVKPDGTIVDPTKLQFPSAGFSEYIPFDGTFECDNCGKTVKEEDTTHYGNYSFCSGECVCRFVGL